MDAPPLARRAAYEVRLASASNGVFWLTCDRPLALGATEMLRSAVRAYKAVPSVLSLATPIRIPTPSQSIPTTT